MYEVPAGVTRHIPVRLGGGVRCLFDAAGARRAWLWLSLAKDGSVIIGSPRPIGQLRTATPPVFNGIAVARHEDARPITNADKLEGFHVTFHTDGAINIAGERWRRLPWKHLTMPHELARVHLQHPSEYITVPVTRVRDILFSHPLIDEHPIVATICRVPPMYAMGIEGSPFQGNALLTVAGDLMRVQISLGVNPSTGYPPATLVAWEGDPCPSAPGGI